MRKTLVVFLLPCAVCVSLFFTTTAGLGNTSPVGSFIPLAINRLLVILYSCPTLQHTTQSHSFQYFSCLKPEPNRRRISNSTNVFHRLSSSASIPLFFAQRPLPIVSTFADRVHRKCSFCFLSTSILQPSELSGIFFFSKRLPLYCLVTVKRSCLPNHDVSASTCSREFHSLAYISTSIIRLTAMIDSP